MTQSRFIARLDLSGPERLATLLGALQDYGERLGSAAAGADIGDRTELERAAVVARELATELRLQNPSISASGTGALPT
jgi:hypothetical protein